MQNKKKPLALLFSCIKPLFGIVQNCNHRQIEENINKVPIPLKKLVKFVHRQKKGLSDLLSLT